MFITSSSYYRHFYVEHVWIMILFSSILAILLFAIPNADAARCDRWNTCYEQMQSHEIATLQGTVMSINRTLSAQNIKVELLELEKSNSFIY